MVAESAFAGLCNAARTIIEAALNIMNATLIVIGTALASTVS